MTRLAGEVNMPKLAGILTYIQGMGVTTFIETGILSGKTTCWATEHFDIVKALEIEIRFIEYVQERCGENVEFIHGDSGETLPIVLETLTQPAVVFLDAHFPGSNTEAALKWAVHCPIKRELAALVSCPVTHFILIDDIGFFTTPEKLPDGSDREQFPLYAEILEQLQPRWDCYKKLGVLAAIPREHLTTTWLLDNGWQGEDAKT